MDLKEFDKEKLIQYWIDGSDDDFETMMVMFDSKKYSWALFIGHLMLEKLFKALYIQKRSDFPPFIHNLLRLAEKAGLDVPAGKKEDLITITAFNINARYDDYKRSFNDQCTSEFTNEWLKKIKEIRLWIKTFIDQ